MAQLEFAVGCTCGSLLGFGLFRPLSRRRATAGPNERFWDVLLLRIESAELGPFLISMTFQSMVYPLSIAYSFYSRHTAAVAWVPSTGSLFQEKLFGQRLFLYLLFGYLLNDLPRCWDNILFRLHHGVSLLGILVLLQAPEGGAPLTLAIFAAECGSLFYNAWLIHPTMLHLPRHFPWWPKSDGLIDVAYRVGMTVSNIVSGFFLIDCLRANWAEHKAFAIFFALTGGPILIMRQKEMFTAIQPGPGVKDQ